MAHKVSPGIHAPRVVLTVDDLIGDDLVAELRRLHTSVFNESSTREVPWCLWNFGLRDLQLTPRQRIEIRKDEIAKTSDGQVHCYGGKWHQLFRQLLGFSTVFELDAATEPPGLGLLDEQLMRHWGLLHTGDWLVTQYEGAASYGLHVDCTDAEPRMLTLLVYLSEVSSGGETHFPNLSLNDDVLEQLLSSGTVSDWRTRSSSSSSSSNSSAAAAAGAGARGPAAEGLGVGVGVKPKRGRGVLFRHLDEDGRCGCTRLGSADCLQSPALHQSLPSGDGSEKKVILQKFYGLGQPRTPSSQVPHHVKEAARQGRAASAAGKAQAQAQAQAPVPSASEMWGRLPPQVSHTGITVVCGQRDQCRMYQTNPLHKKLVYKAPRAAAKPQSSQDHGAEL